MATMVLNRTSEYGNRLRNFGVFVDGKKAGTIANGETKKFNVLSGQHTLVTKIDWCSSPTLVFSIGDNEIKNFKVGGFRNAKWLMPTALIIIILSYIVSFIYEIDYLFYLVIPFFILIVYYLTIGRKRYLTLIETNAEREESIAN